MTFRVKVIAALAVSGLGVAAVSAVALAKDSSKFDTSLNGYEELPTLSTRGNGTFEASLNKDGSRTRSRTRGRSTGTRPAPRRR